MTAEELLATMAEPLAEDDGYCTIDPETRVITIPPEYQLLGVESDEKAERIYFKCPKIVGDDIDLSKLALRVNFRNAGQAVDQYLVDDVAVDGDNITFSWLLSRRVTQYEGDVNFIVCAVRVSGETITNEWNTTLATAQVLEGLEAEMVLPEEETDIVNQLLSLAETRLNDVKEATADANTAASNANQKAQEAENAAEDARAVTEQITKDSYLHTALQSFIDTVTATPTAYGNAVVKKIEGFTRQETTQGLNLCDYHSINGETFAGITVSIDEDGYIILNGTSTSAGSINMPLKENLKAGTKVWVSCENAQVNENVYVGFADTAGLRVSAKLDAVNKKSMGELIDTTTSIQIYIYGANVTLTNFRFRAMASLTDAEWEPYTGGQPAPNPDYPQVIHGVGDMGFFDGELLQGYWDVTSSNFISYANYVCNANKIKCKQNDEITVLLEDSDITDFLIIFFDESNTKISYSTNHTATAPQNTSSMGFRYRKDGVTPETAGHIGVTINDKYAVCVKSEGINLCAYVESGDYLHSNGKPSSTENYVRTNKMIVKPNTVYKESSVIEGTVTKTAVFWDENKTFIKHSSFDSDIQTPSNCKCMALNYNADGLTVSKVRDVMITEKSVFPNTYVPYQSNVTYIPVDYPLFEGDKIIQRNGEYKLVRKWKQVIFDGSEDEVWSENKIDNGLYQGIINNLVSAGGTLNADTPDKIKSSIGVTKDLNSPSSTTVTEGAWIYEKISALIVVKTSRLSEQTAAGLKTWLQSNPVTVVYELDTPTEEELSSEAKKALHSIMATDEQTELTIVGVPADAGIQNQFLLPRNEDGALNTTAYCTAEKNKIVLNELVAQNLDARVNKLEIDNAALAEQTIVVE